MVDFEISDAGLLVISLTAVEPPLAGEPAEGAFGYAIESGHDPQITPITRIATKSLVIFCKVQIGVICGSVSSNCDIKKEERGWPAMRTYLCALALSIASLLLSVAPVATLQTKPAEQVLFDDFSYTDKNQLKKNGWIIRTVPGWPGVPGAHWLEEGVSLLKDPNQSNNHILRMTSATDGPGANTTQTQICHQRKYLEGTYAARVRFTDDPVSGPGGDQIVQSFYTISPLKAPMDLDYSELDYEYLPNGGWGIDGPTLYATTWETFSPEPNWKKDNVFKTANGSQAGWHTLVTQVHNKNVRYFVDGKLFAEHGGNYYPEDTMSINFNLWFIRDGMKPANERRQYQEDIDWVFHQAGVALTPEQVEAAVAAMRRKSIKFRDTVPAKVPALTSPCNF